MRFLKILLLLFLFMPTQLIKAQDYLTKPENGIRYLDSDEIKQHEKSGGYYNEFWNYHISLDNGSEIYLNYSISHFGGVRDAVTGARLSLLNWNGENYKAAREYGLDKLVFDEKDYKFLLNKERGIWYEGKLPNKHKVHYKTNKNDTHFDINLDFVEIKSAFTWGDGKFKMGDNDLSGMYTQIPSAKIEGFIALDFDTVYVSGTASMVQFHQTNIATRLFEKSFRYDKITGNGYLGGYFLIPKDANTEIVGYGYENKNGELVLKKPTSITTKSTKEFKGETVASEIEICYQEQECERIQISDISEKITMLDELSGLKKMFAKRFLGGDIIELRGSALLNKINPVSFSLTVLD